MFEDAADTVRGPHRQGLRRRLMYDRQPSEVDGRCRFRGGLVLGTLDGFGVRYDCPVVGLPRGGGAFPE